MKFARFLAFLAIGVFVLAGLLPILSGNLEAAEGTEEDPIAIQLGQTWRYTPTFDLDLNPTLTVAADLTAMPTDDATFGASSGYATIDGKDVVVAIPGDAVAGDYYVKIKAETQNPSQTEYQAVVFAIQTPVIITVSDIEIAVGAEYDPPEISTSVTSVLSIVDDGGLSSVSISEGRIQITASEADVGIHELQIRAVPDNARHWLPATATVTVTVHAAAVPDPDPEPNPDPEPGTPEKKWKVKIVLNGVDVKEVTVQDGESLDPKIPGMKYYLDEDGMEQWIVGTPITEDTTIYAFLPAIPKAITLPVILILFVTAIILIAAIVTRNPIIAALGFVFASIATILYFGKGRF